MTLNIKGSSMIKFIKKLKLSDELKLKQSKLNYDDFKNKYFPDDWIKREFIEESCVVYSSFFKIFKRFKIRRGIYLYNGYANMVSCVIGRVNDIDESILLYINDINSQQDIVKFSIESDNHVTACCMYNAYAYQFEPKDLLYECFVLDSIVEEVYPELIRFGMISL